MFLQSQHLVLQKFRIRHDRILSIRRISDFRKNVGFRHIPNSSVDVKSENRTLSESQYVHLVSVVVPVHKEEAINIE